jgi:hypothetical protein
MYPLFRVEKMGQGGKQEEGKGCLEEGIDEDFFMINTRFGVC